MSIAYRDKRDRAFNPVDAREPLSGRAAAFFGGGFKPKGVPALYSSVRIMTALRQANQVGSLQPTTRVAYEAEIDTLFDCPNETAFRKLGLHASLVQQRWLARTNAFEGSQRRRF